MSAVRIILLAALFVISGCSDSATQVSFPALPDEMKDCKIYAVSNTSGQSMTVARCPNSTTATQIVKSSGKTRSTKTAIVIDGVEYAPVEAKP